MMARCKLNPCCGETMPGKCNPPPQIKQQESWEDYERRITASDSRVSELQAENEKLMAAFEPFLSIKDAVAVQDSVKLVSKDRFDGMTPISVTVTKEQYLAAIRARALAKDHANGQG